MMDTINGEQGCFFNGYNKHFLSKNQTLKDSSSIPSSKRSHVRGLPSTNSQQHFANA